jgi:hypothetical protein
MHRVLIVSVLGVCLAGNVACSRKRDEMKARPSLTDVAGATADRGHVEVTGCLSNDPQTNRFVLTAHRNQLSTLANRAAAGEAENFHYVLVGGNDLQSMLGKEVKVTGDVVGKGKDVDVKQSETAKDNQKPATDAAPAVKTTEEIELQVEQLNVSSIAATGSPCQTGQ